MVAVLSARTTPATALTVALLCRALAVVADAAAGAAASALVGRRRPSLGVAVWTAALRLFLPADVAAVRPNPAVPLRWRHAVLIAQAAESLANRFGRAARLTVSEGTKIDNLVQVSHNNPARAATRRRGWRARLRNVAWTKRRPRSRRLISRPF